MARATSGQAMELREVLTSGLIGGVLAGFAFLFSEVVLFPLRYLSPFVPLQMFASLALGPGVMPPALPTVLSTIVGLVVALGLAAIYGVVLAVIAYLVPGLREFTYTMVGAGIIYGLLIWFINFIVIAPTFFPWFITADPFSYPFTFAYVREFANPVIQLISHIIFGVVLGYYLAVKLGRVVEPE